MNILFAPMNLFPEKTYLALWVLGCFAIGVAVAVINTAKGTPRLVCSEFWINSIGLALGLLLLLIGFKSLELKITSLALKAVTSANPAASPPTVNFPLELVAFWTIVPPIWFFIEYSLFFYFVGKDEPNKLANFKSSQEAAGKIWLAVLAVLLITK